MKNICDANGREFPGILVYTYPEHIRDFLATGINVFRFSLPLGWKGLGVYDYSEGDKIMAAFCEAGPDVKVFPMIWIDGPESKWWELEYPEEVAQMRSRATGEYCTEVTGVPKLAKPGIDFTPKGDLFDRLHQGVPCVHSFASAIWRKQAAEAVAHAVAHYAQKFPDRLAGIYLCAGLSHEWFNWGNYTDAVLFDYSLPMRDYFRRWLAHRYGSVEALGTAWHRAFTDWESVEPPLPAQRPAHTDSALPDPATHRPAADFAAALADAQMDCFLTFCQAARSQAPAETLLGGFYGYWWTQTDFPSPARNGHLALQRLLESPDVDFLASPLDYSNRGVGGVTSSQSLTGSASIHGKRFINSADVKLSQEKHGDWHAFVTVPKNDAESVELLKRDFGFSMAEGLWHSWVDLFGGVFSRPEINATLVRLQTIARENRDLRRPPKSQALFVIDEESLRNTTPSNGLWTVLFPVQKQWNQHRSGFPWTFITLEDYLHGDWPEARLVHFANVFRGTPDLRNTLHTKLRSSQATAIWNLFPGFLGEAALDLSLAEKLTGFSLFPLDVSAGDWNFLSTEAGQEFGVPQKYGTSCLRESCRQRMKHYPSPEQLAGSPRLGIHPGTNDEALSRWEDASAIGLARTEQLGFSSVFNAGPLLPATVLHALAQQAGVHCYTPAGDVVYANERFLCIQAGHAESRTVQLPRGMTAQNLWDAGSLLGPGSFELQSPPDTVHFWRLTAP
jgi:hypothetical protein